MKFASYFWDLNEAELAEARRTLKDPSDPRFVPRMMTLLSRCDKPAELFSILPRKRFVDAWPRIRTYWLKRVRVAPQRDWWETLYEQLVEAEPAKTSGVPSSVFRKLGETVKDRRLELGLSQKQLAQRTQLSQSVVSQIEDGKKNLTLFTLVRVFRVLGIQSLSLG